MELDMSDGDARHTMVYQPILSDIHLHRVGCEGINAAGAEDRKRAWIYCCFWVRIVIFIVFNYNSRVHALSINGCSFSAAHDACFVK